MTLQEIKTFVLSLFPSSNGRALLSGTAWDITATPQVEKILSANTAITLSNVVNGKSAGVLFVTGAGYTLTIGGTAVPLKSSGITAVSVYVLLDGSLQIESSAEPKTPATFTDGATITLNLSVTGSYNWKGTIGGNRTLAFSGAQSGDHFQVAITQDGTGSRTVTWPSGIKWKGGTVPTLTTAAGSTDVFVFFYDGTTYFGVYGNDFK